jgi:hypothetical protein
MSPPPIPKHTKPVPAPAPPDYPLPTLSIRVDTLAHPGAVLFFDAVHPTTVLRDAVAASFTWLYTPDSRPTHVQSILLVLRSMDGIAYTSGSDTHKEIHFSVDYILAFADKPAPAPEDGQRTLRVKNEVYGVVTHEVVHCYQYNALGTCPEGLIEGIADFVRLNAGFVPPHWRRAPGDEWDAGYQTTAYFLDWVEQRAGPGTVRRLNECMRDVLYDVVIFEDVTGSSVKALWALYCEGFETPEA